MPRDAVDFLIKQIIRKHNVVFGNPTDDNIVRTMVREAYDLGWKMAGETAKQIIKDDDNA